MIRALLEATGAVWWGSAAIVLAVVGIGLLRAFWRDWRTPRCRYCLTDLTLRNTHFRYGHLCGACGYAWESRARRVPREVLG